MARDRFARPNPPTFYHVPLPDDESLPGVSGYDGPTLYGDTYDTSAPMPGQPGYGVVADAPIQQDRAEQQYLADRVAAESPGGRELNRRLRESRNAEEDLGYSPIAMGMNAVPFSDEILGLASSIGDDAPSYDEAQQAWSDARNAQSTNNPWSTRIGALGQMAITAPIPIAGSVAEFTLPNVLRAAAPTAIGGTVAGAVGGAATARPGERLEGALHGGLTGGTLGTIAGLGGAVGQGLRLSAAAPEVGNAGTFFRRAGAGASEGLGYSAAATADMMPGRISDYSDAADTFERVAPYGAAMGAGIAPLAEAAAVPFRAIRRIAGQSAPEFTAPTGSTYDEVLGDISGAVPEGELPGLSAEYDLAASADRTRARIASERGEGGLLENATRLGLRKDPTASRLQSIGLAGNEIDRAAASFGGPRNLLEAARRHGWLRELSTYDPGDELRVIAEGRDEAGRQIQQDYRRMREAGVSESGATIADDIDAIAEQMAAVRDPRAQARAAALRDQANMYRYGTDAPLSADELQYMEGVESPQVPADELFTTLRYRSDQNQQAWRTPGERLRPEQQAMLDVQRAEIRARRRMAERLFTPEEYARHQLVLDRYHTGRALAGAGEGVPGIDQRQWGDFRGVMGAGLGADAMRTVPGFNNPLGSALGAAGGFVASRLGARYQPSIMATINESGFASMPQTLQGTARSVIESIRRGGASTTVPDAIARMAEHPPQSEAEIAAGLEALRSYAREAGPEAQRVIQPAEAQAEWPALIRTVDRVARAAPERFGQIGDMLRSASERGTLPVVVQYLARTDPDTVARIRAEVDAEMATGTGDGEARAIDAHTERLRSRLRARHGIADPNATPDPEQQAIDAHTESLRERLRRMHAQPAR